MSLILGLIFGAVAALGTAAVIAVYLLTVDFLANWFRERAARVQFDGNKVAISVAEDLENGHYGVVQGIFDKSRGSFDEVRQIDATTLDDEVAAMHRRDRIQVWQ